MDNAILENPSHKKTIISSLFSKLLINETSAREKN